MSNSFNTRFRPGVGLVRPSLTVWFTGLSGSGKTTISRSVYAELNGCGYRVQALDGDDLRQNLSKDLGFSREDRNENVRRIALVVESLMRNGFVVLVAAISPYRAVRKEVRDKLGRFLEVYVDAPLAICEQRDPKGLYARARKGELHGLTGIDAPYEAPLAPDLRCQTDQESLEVCTSKVISAVSEYLSSNAVL